MINLKIARYRFLLWILAFLLTAASAVYQRMTGPTYPVKGKVEFAESLIKYKFLRTETVGSNALVTLDIPDRTITAFITYKRFKSNDDWLTIELARKDNTLSVELPAQPAAGKLIYTVYLNTVDNQIIQLGADPVILRYKGAVPTWVLLPHILIMFIAMIFSNRALLESLDSKGRAKFQMRWTIILLIAGGFILGPIMQKYAFGAFWTGIPFGTDLTDNKTLVALVAWLIALYKNRRRYYSRSWVMIASLVTLAVYLIPHSLLGSEMDYTQ